MSVAIFHVEFFNPFVWDCTHWPAFGEGNVECKVNDAAGNVYWLIRFGAHTCYCIVKTYNKYIGIVDKLKKIFEIERLGYRTFYFEGKWRIARPAQLDAEGRPIANTLLKYLPSDSPLLKSPQFREQVRRILTFRDLLAISSNFESNIAVIEGQNGDSAVSINEVSSPVVKGADNQILSRRLLDVWFNDKSVSQTLADMISYNGDLYTTTCQLTSLIEDAITEVSPEEIWYANFIISRLTQRLHSLSHF